MSFDSCLIKIDSRQSLQEIVDGLLTISVFYVICVTLTWTMVSVIFADGNHCTVSKLLSTLFHEERSSRTFKKRGLKLIAIPETAINASLLNENLSWSLKTLSVYERFLLLFNFLARIQTWMSLWKTINRKRQTNSFIITFHKLGERYKSDVCSIYY